MISPRLAWTAFLPLAACAAPAEQPSSTLDGARERMTVESYSTDAKREPTTIGLHLARLDRSIQGWNQLFLNGSESTDAQRLKGLYEDISFRTGKLFHEIVAELETGPLLNRRIAAAAIGFVRADESLSPLLNALSDQDDQVVANALLSLAVLGDANTPTGSLSHFVQFGSTPVVRSNASLALLEVLRSGGDGGEEVKTAARSALHDDDPGVRTQAALVLAHQLDVSAFESLGLQLVEDPVPSAAMAAGRALAYIGQRLDTYQGASARALTAALGRVDGRVRASLLNDLRKLAGANYAKDEDWIAWAHRLPPGPG